MTKDTSAWWREVSPYLDQALDMRAADRPAWLASLRNQNPSLASSVEMLLEEHEALAREGFLERGPDALLSGGTTAGTVIGAYRLLAPIGEGGMGTVWLGERADGEIQRQVAIKLLSTRYRPRWRERFLRERQLLASLNHPAIVQLIDAGHLPDGRPYLVMEYVDGDPIDVHAARVSVAERLELFLRVCEAVSHAHQRLIIHRDLKPTNILVDRSGQPKLLDFGIAKLLDDDRDMTQTVERMMTPLYASPEQRAGAAQTTATDVYSLGAVLYKLLTGRSPHDGTSAGAARGVTAARDTAASRLNPNVPVDADYILRKALRDEPEERYHTVDAFAADIRALLRSRPVEARAGDSWYRARKFLRRNRVAVAAAALVVASLSAGLYVANREREIAQQRFQQVRQLANRFIALDAEIRELPGSTKVRSQIVAESLDYLASLGRDARGDTDLALEIGNAYLQVARVQGIPFLANLGLVAEAEESLRQADVFVDSVLASDEHHRTALLSSAQIAHDRMALVDNQDRRDDALAQARRAVTQLDRFMNGNTPNPDQINAATQIYSNVAVAYQNSNQFEESIRYSRRAVEISAGVAAAETRRASALGVLSYGLRRVGDFDEALAAGQQSRQLLEQLVSTGGGNRFNLTNAFWREGLVLGEANGPSLQRTDEALRAFQKALDIAEEQADRDPDDSRSRERIGVMAREIGDLLLPMDPHAALSIFDRGLARIREVETNARSQRVEAQLLSSSSYAARAIGRAADAKARIDSAFTLLRATEQYPAESIEPTSEPHHALRALADHHIAVGEPAAALAIYEDLLDKILKAGAKPESDLRDAVVMDDTWSALSGLLPPVGRAEEVRLLTARRVALWSGWLRKRPDNPFIRRRMELLPKT